MKLKRPQCTSFLDLPVMLNVKEVANILRISRAGAYNLINSEGFPKMAVGKRVLVPRDDLRQWIKQNKQ